MEFLFDEMQIISSEPISDWFSFTVYSCDAPSVGDMVKIGEDNYLVHSVADDTDDIERELVLYYSKVWLLCVEAKLSINPRH